MHFLIIGLKAAARKRKNYLERTIIDHRFPMRFPVVYGHGCSDLFHFDLCHLLNPLAKDVALRIKCTSALHPAAVARKH